MRSITAILVAALVVIGASIGVAADPQVTLVGPKETSVGADFQVSYSGPTAPLDFISIDKPGAADGDYGVYAYVQSGNPVRLRAPDEPGEYLIRIHREKGYGVAATTPLAVKDVKATLEGPARADAGAQLEIKFTGPANTGDFISIDKVGDSDRTYGPYVYSKQGSPAKLRAPDQSGAYQLRYHLGQSYRVIASQPLDIGQTSAALDAPAAIAAGGEIKVTWTGPNKENDFISVDKTGAPDRDYGPYAYTRGGSPVAIRIPEDSGDYVIRYHTGQTYKVLAERPLTVNAVTASLNGPATVVARSVFEVSWTGPANAEDYIAIAPKDAPATQQLGYAYTKRGNPARLEAPKESGVYELRYLTGGQQKILARAAVEVTPGTKLGRLKVTSPHQEAKFGAVELILDASGSMLQRLGGKRRIDIAKDALTELTRDVLPAGAPFALRVFGHREASSCRTDLEITLAPLDRKAALAKIKGIESKNLAKTPIGESLLQVKQDLSGAQGTAIVVLVTDGEETCDGDPKAAIESLRGAGFDVRVNIVGFAVDELALKEQFESWAQLGGGGYFDASDAKALSGAMRASLRLPYSVKKDGAMVASGVVNGDAVELLPGTYQVEILSTPARQLDNVTITSDQETPLAAD